MDQSLKQGAKFDISAEVHDGQGAVDAGASITSLDITMTPTSGEFGTLTPPAAAGDPYTVEVGQNVGDTAEFTAKATVTFADGDSREIDASATAVVSADADAADTLVLVFKPAPAA